VSRFRVGRRAATVGGGRAAAASGRRPPPGRHPWPRRRPPPRGGGRRRPPPGEEAAAAIGEDGGRRAGARGGRCPSRRRPWRPPPVPRAVAASAAASKKAPSRALLSLIVVTQISWFRCRRVLQDSRCRAARVVAFVMTEALGSRPAPGTPSAKRPVGTRRAASMQDTLSEGTARAAQLAPSAVTAGAVGGPAIRGVVQWLAESLRTSEDERLVEEYA